MKSMKTKKTKELRSKLLIVAMTAVLAVSAATYTVSAQSVPSSSITSSARLKAAAGGITDIDFPSNGASVSGTINVAGWALNASGVSRVDVWAWDSNGHPHNLGSTSTFTARPDVKNALPAYNALDSGYSVSVDTTKLAAGTYTLAVAGIGKNGVATWTTKTMIVGPSALTDIDAPAGEQDGNFTVSGWALNHSGIKRVDVWAWDSNGKAHSLGSVAADALVARQDVKNALPAYNTLNSGYSLTVADKTLSTGSYTLAVAGIGNDGDVQWATKNITIGPAPLTDIDTYGPMDNGTLNVVGWVLNKSGISRVDMYAWDSNGKAHALGSVSADKLTARSDVQKAYPAFGALNSGYWLTVPAGTLSAGNYTLAVAGIGNDGMVQWASKTITIQGTAPAAQITDIDTPATTYTGTIPVTGWALNSSGIDRVDIYAYPVGSNTAISLGSVSGSKLTARADVKNAYPAYGTLNSGYSLTVPAGTLAPGNYTLATAGIGNDGTVKWATQGITVATVANYQGTNVTKTYTDEITGVQQTVQFGGVGAGYQEVAVAGITMSVPTTLAQQHSGFGTIKIVGTNGFSQSQTTGSTGATMTAGNLTDGTYTVTITAHDGTVTAKIHFTVDAHGNVD